MTLALMSPNILVAEVIVSPQQVSKQQKSLISLDIDALLDIEVSSVSKKVQKISEAAAAIFVISNDDIKRSGVTSIPEALRLAPGIDVAKIDGNKWAVSSRGFNKRYSNKLLVLIDGRSVYSPFFSGVNWDTQDTLLEDIEKIEVIRGSGASLWGANAVNGVINIITKKAEDSQGVYLSTGSGTKERLFGRFRYGGKINDETHYRVYGKYFERENNKGFDNEFVNDDWRATRGGFRLDWNPSTDDQLMVQGDIYETISGQSIDYPNLATLSNQLIHADEKTVGGNILFNWKHAISDDNQTTLQAYYDITESNIFWINRGYQTLDIDFQHTITLFDDHQFIWGAGYRFISDFFEGSYFITPNKEKEKSHLFSFFLQDEISLINNELTLILGSKFEHNDFTGFEIQPNVRLIWNPTENQTLWGSVSRSVRTPSRIERKGRINQRFVNIPTVPIPVLISLIDDDNKDSSSEELLAYELGYRFIPNNDWSIDLALFYNNYDKLFNANPQSPFFEDNHFVSALNLSNKMTGETYGIELATAWNILDNWRINASYSYLQMQFHVENGLSSISETSEASSPHHKFSLFSRVNILPNLEWNMWLKYADNVPEFKIPSYLTLDAGLSWQVNKMIELSVMGQNLLESSHSEYQYEFIPARATQVERSVYGKISLRF